MLLSSFPHVLEHRGLRRNQAAESPLFLIIHPIGMHIATAAMMEKPLFQSAAMNKKRSAMSISRARAGSHGYPTAR
jgi:hypothetical protein